MDPVKACFLHCFRIFFNNMIMPWVVILNIHNVKDIDKTERLPTGGIQSLLRMFPVIAFTGGIHSPVSKRLHSHTAGIFHLFPYYPKVLPFAHHIFINIFFGNEGIMPEGPVIKLYHIYMILS